MNELMWTDGKRPEPEEGDAPIYTKTGLQNFWGFEEKKPREGPIDPPLFTRTGWANMKKKYGTEVEVAAPLYTRTGLADWVGWGTKWNAEDINITDAPIYTRGFYEGIGFSIEPE